MALTGGHGTIVAGVTLEATVTTAIYLMVNTRIVRDAASLPEGGLATSPG